MTQHIDHEDEEPCLCTKFVPADKRIDVEQVVLDEQTGKRRWKVMLRAHQDCPDHGLKEITKCPEDSRQTPATPLNETE